ncbi:MAG TPA: amidase [Solirubrobacterales bacterium]|nr:amidase [Solirubrobacterales bacterium]
MTSASAVDLLDRSLRDQAGAIAGGEADPGELLDAALARIEDRNPAVNAIVEVFPEESRRMLAEAPRGPLYGVPVAIKDEWPLPWRAQRLGAAEYVGPAPEPGESGPYRALRDAGAVIVGVANMHEYGSGSTGHISAFGPARNPWDTDRAPGGSSSGPAAAVAARLVAGAVGADGVGSIRYPAAYCGLTGLKPTFGRSTMAGHHVPQTTTIVSGPLCRDAADCRLLSGVLFGEVLCDGEADGMRIGVVPGELWDDCQPAVREACRGALDLFRDATGADVAEVDFDGREHVLIASVLVGQTEDLAHMTPERIEALGDDVSLIARALLRYRMLIPAVAIAKAGQVRTLVRRSLAELFEQIDVLAWPTVAAPAPRLDDASVELPSGVYPADYVNPRQGGIANLAGVPAISVPVGQSPKGLPVALQLIAAWGRDELLLDAAEALERATEREWVDAAPALAA